MKEEKCEYKGCQKKATRKLKSDVGVLAVYCEDHYKIVLQELRDSMPFLFRRNNLNLDV